MPETGTPTPPTRVLVVDDDPVTRLLCSQALSSVGMEVDEVEGGVEALEALGSNRPDLMILDLEMPRMDGYEVCRHIRSRPAWRNLPVLILTGHTDSETIDQAFAVGATDFVQKPIDWSLLRHRVRFLMHAHTASGRLQRTMGELRDSEARLAKAQRLARIGSWQWTPQKDEMLWSEEVFRILGLEPGAVEPSRGALLDAAHPEDRGELESSLEQALEEAMPWCFEHRLLLADGEIRFVQQQAEIERRESGSVLRASGTIQDVTERRRAEEKIRYLAHYDSLTALPNRRMLTEHLERVIGRAHESNEKVALLFVDLDRFKRINDTLGHAVGDALLKAVAERLVGSVRSIDQVSRPNAEQRATVSRLGGDEFTVVLREQKSPRGAARVARRILNAMRKPFRLDGHRLDVSASVGIALFPDDGVDPDALLRNADAAMYHAKQLGRDVFQFFSESINQRAMRNLRLESGLRLALERDELLLHYQPQIDARAGDVIAVEALVRWSSPELGLVPPNEFIGIAEESGLIVPLGEWVLREACAQNRAWQDAGLPPLRLGVNVSSVQLCKGDLAATVERVLRETGHDAGLLELEITESALLADDPGVDATLARLRDLGVRLALDDFGTGYSSLSRLVRFPIDALKIDRGFVARVGRDAQGDAIVAAVVALAHRLGLTVTGEGVETEGQERLLQDEGCDLLQGFRFSRPVEPEALVRYLSGQDPAVPRRPESR